MERGRKEKNCGVMEFLQGRESYCEEEEEEEEKQVMLGDMGKRPFHFSPSSSPSSPSTKYRGVVPRPNGQWGAQIYENHQRVWLGTFDTEEEAARAYNQAVVHVCGRKGVTNFNQHDLIESSGISDAANEGGDGIKGGSEKEHMFDKVVTPSDVGKLNRLVIPKQHAEKYFPLDSAANEKGLLLNFEDRNGKPWRFRYSYWNSSQSYVMTKGWSRFVKEKKLDAGDIVSFERGVGESGKDRFYIDWKRRPDAALASSSIPPFALPHPLSLHRSVPWGRVFLPPAISMSMPRSHMHMQQLNCDYPTYGGAYGYNVVNSGGSIYYVGSNAGPPQISGMPLGGPEGHVVIDSIPVVHPKAEGKRLRLFGVNLDCPSSEDGVVLSPPAIMMEPQHPLQLRLFNGTPLSAPESRTRGKQPLSLDLDI